MATTATFLKMKQEGKKITMLTAYDATFSSLINGLGADIILVGDTLGHVVQGHHSTVPVSIKDMVYHTQCVKRGVDKVFIISDLPFMTYATPELAMKNAAKLMQAGANMVKLEGGAWLLPTITQLVERGIPVCSHLGLTPQSVNQLGGYKIQGRDSKTAEKLISDARAVEEAGAQLLVLECVPKDLARQITEQLTIPVIGIGAGAGVDGQVLVLHDMLGITPGKQFTFTKDFMQESNNGIAGAINSYLTAVREGEFPLEEHSFS